MEISVTPASEVHYHFAESICRLMAEAAQQRGTGIAKRSPEYLKEKMKEGKAVIALFNGQLAGFCYIETWSHDKYVAHSGLIVHPDFRGTGLGKKIKEATFRLSREKFPNSKIFGITTSLAVMKINSDLGYKPVTFSELTTDDAFWRGCQSCKNYDILTRTNRAHCLCTGMMYKAKPEAEKKEVSTKKMRWQKFKRFVMLKGMKAKRRMVSLIV